MKGIPDPPTVYSRSYGLKGKAVEARDDGAFLVSFDTNTEIWLPREDLLTQVEYDKSIRDFYEEEMNEAFRIKDPKGILDMARQVKLVVGEGDDKIEVGKADLETMSNGDVMATLSITNSALIKALGGAEVKGIIPKFSEEESSE